MKKEGFVNLFSLLILGALVFSILVSFASAQQIAIEIGNSIKEGVKYSYDSILNPENKFYVIKWLFFFITLLFIGAIVSAMPLFRDRPFIAFLLSISTTFLAVVFIPDEFLELALYPYQALGLALLSIFPFICMFIFVHKIVRNRFIRQAAWIFFALILVGLSIYPWLSAEIPNIYAYIYAGAGVLAVVMVFIAEPIARRFWRGRLAGEANDALMDVEVRRRERDLERQEARARGLTTDEFNRGRRPAFRQ